jgi:hypothetical protein
MDILENIFVLSTQHVGIILYIAVKVQTSLEDYIRYIIVPYKYRCLSYNDGCNYVTHKKVMFSERMNQINLR